MSMNISIATKDNTKNHTPFDQTRAMAKVMKLQQQAKYLQDPNHFTLNTASAKDSNDKQYRSVSVDP